MVAAVHYTDCNANPREPSRPVKSRFPPDVLTLFLSTDTIGLCWGCHCNKSTKFQSL